MSCGQTDGTNGGGTGNTGGEEGQDPTAPVPPWTAQCAGEGTVPTGTNGTDSESWEQ